MNHGLPVFFFTMFPARCELLVFFHFVSGKVHLGIPLLMNHGFLL
uniref:Uncharacterized protein n=1 Tax=Arundo donax TaxID=35708 RepID=A0A0A9H7L4_ARUDO